MTTTTPPTLNPSADIVSLDVARQRRYYIELANANAARIQTKTSFALKGTEATDDDAARAGRMIAGHATCDQIQQELRDEHARQK